jgi:hypothetical protein
MPFVHEKSLTERSRCFFCILAGAQGDRSKWLYLFNFALYKLISDSVLALSRAEADPSIYVQTHLSTLDATQSPMDDCTCTMWYCGYSPPFPCLTVVGRERGAGTSSTQIVVKERESKVKPTIEAFPIGPKNGEPFRRLPKKGILGSRLEPVRQAWRAAWTSTGR